MDKKKYLPKLVHLLVVMVTIFSLVPITTVAGITAVPHNHKSTNVTKGAYAPDRLLVHFAPKADGKQRTTVEKNQILSSLDGATIKKEFKVVPGLSVVELPKGKTVADVLAMYNETDEILYAEPDYIVSTNSTTPNDTYFSLLWGLHNTGQTVNGTSGTADDDIDAPEAWDTDTGSSSVIVAVIDTGVDWDHEDLSGNMWVNIAESTGDTNVDDDENGYVDDIYGYDFCNDDGDPNDDNWHGTHVAGTIGAVGNNSTGTTGVCWDVNIMALKFLDANGDGYTSDAIDCIQYSIDMGANLTNNSWGGSSYSQSLKNVIEASKDAGMLFVAAAGNDEDDTDVDPHYPSSYDCDNIISVMATDQDDAIADEATWGSNYGANTVDIAAPGTNIASCYPSDNYVYAGGTSQAAPHVAGACALLLSEYPSLTWQEVKQTLLDSVDTLGVLSGKCTSGGRLNIQTAFSNLPISTDDHTPVAYWKFDETSGSIAEDSITIHDGTLTNFPTNDSQWVTGYHGGALDFDGTNDYVVATGCKGLTVDMSNYHQVVTAWIKTDGGSDGTIISWGEDEIRKMFEFLVNSSGKLQLNVGDGYDIIGTAEVDDGEWHHVAVVSHGYYGPPYSLSEMIKFYVDGELDDDSSSDNSYGFNPTSNANVTIGACFDGSNYFDGLIDDVRIYDDSTLDLDYPFNASAFESVIEDLNDLLTGPTSTWPNIYNNVSFYMLDSNDDGLWSHIKYVAAEDKNLSNHCRTDNESSIEYYRFKSDFDANEITNANRYWNWYYNAWTDVGPPAPGRVVPISDATNQRESLAYAMDGYAGSANYDRWIIPCEDANKVFTDDCTKRNGQPATGANADDRIAYADDDDIYLHATVVIAASSGYPSTIRWKCGYSGVYQCAYGALNPYCLDTPGRTDVTYPTGSSPTGTWDDDYWDHTNADIYYDD